MMHFRRQYTHCLSDGRDDLHAGGPDELFAGRENVINAVFQTLASLEPRVRAAAG
jgi:hypothetical protein